MPDLSKWTMILAMRRHLVLMFAVACMTFAMVGVSVADDRARIALVIGNGDYKGNRLSATPNDAKLIAETLRDLGFDVVDHQNLDLASMKQAIQDLGNRLRGAGSNAVGVFFYAGHGVQVGGENFLVPIGVDTEGGIGDVAVNASTVFDALKTAGNGINFVLLDASYINRYGRAFGSRKAGLAAMAPPDGALIAFSAAPDKIAVKTSGDHSNYSKAVVKMMETGGTPVQQLFQLVRMNVMAGSLTKQIPWERSSLKAEFIFSPEE
jgi:uncharacterized caspase-like protein